jgi:6-pyruvoyltetrahydropterin/6-carboxytetrahydropterin synthase
MKELLLHTEATIDSCHRLVGYQGNCSRLHGHTWHIEVWIKGFPKDLNEIGILWDFGLVKKIRDKFDHQYINDIPPFNEKNPTAENLSMYFYEELKLLNTTLSYCIRVYETKVSKETWCQYGDFSV